jgi:hypothetical protein
MRANYYDLLDGFWARVDRAKQAFYTRHGIYSAAPDAQAP